MYFKYPVLIDTSYRDCALSPISAQAWGLSKGRISSSLVCWVFFTKVTQAVDQSTENHSGSWPAEEGTGRPLGIAEHTDHASESPFSLLLIADIPLHSHGKAVLPLRLLPA